MIIEFLPVVKVMKVASRWNHTIKNWSFKSVVSPGGCQSGVLCVEEEVERVRWNYEVNQNNLVI